MGLSAMKEKEYQRPGLTEDGKPGPLIESMTYLADKKAKE